MMLFLVGQRRVGKSFLLRELHVWIKENRPDANVVYINKELQSFSSVKTSDDLYSLVNESLPSESENYLLIDEVQDIEGYENALRSLYAEHRCQIVATGSNAYIFSSELGTRLAGRYIEIPVFSMTYPEFLEFHNLKDSEHSLATFMKVGGLPGLRNFDIEDEAQVKDYLQGVYNTIMMRDIITRQKIRNIPSIENLAQYIADNVGKPFSTRNISNSLTSAGTQTSAPIVANYVRYLCDALIISQVARYDIHGKKIFESNFKYYFEDQGLRNLLTGFNLRGSVEKIIENLVYNHFRYCGFNVKVGELRKSEIDFVAERGHEKIYVQATYLLASDETIKREFGNLAAIPDNYPKYVISMDPVGGELPDYPGIRHIRLRDFLKTTL